MMNIVQEHTLNAELWIDDIFIRQGLKNILADIVFEATRRDLYSLPRITLRR